MSPITTPTRVARSVFVPGIDTKALNDNDSNATALAYGGLHTPPQSAHESRRPSLLDVGLLGTQYSTASSPFAPSHPPTPIRVSPYGDDAVNRGWFAGTDGHGGLVNANPTRVCYRPLPSSLAVEDMMQPLFPQPSSVDTDVMYAVTPYHPGPREAWHSLQQSQQPYVPSHPGLGSTLFSLPGDMSSNNSQASLHGRNIDAAPAGPVLGHVPSQHVVYHQPQVLVPSQLSPQDEFTLRQSYGYAIPEQSIDTTNNFHPSTVHADGWEFMRPPSPLETTLVRHADEEYVLVPRENDATNFEDEDYDVVKGEDFDNSPHTPPLTSSPSAYTPARLRKRRSNTGRPRKQRECWGSHIASTENNDAVEVSLVGKHFEIDSLSRSIRCEAGDTTKPQRCCYVSEDGRRCPRRFQRVEHLKRHVGSHGKTEDRPFPCPIATCITPRGVRRRIGRQDNAIDHFKSHLRVRVHGRRNPLVSWDVLRAALYAEYEETKAKNFDDRLANWIELGMPDKMNKKR